MTCSMSKQITHHKCSYTWMNGRGIGDVNSDITDNRPCPDQWDLRRVWTESISLPVNQRPSVLIRLPGDCTHIYLQNMQYNITNASKVAHTHASAFSALEVFLNDMRYINPRFTYLLTCSKQRITDQFSFCLQVSHQMCYKKLHYLSRFHVNDCTGFSRRLRQRHRDVEWVKQWTPTFLAVVGCRFYRYHVFSCWWHSKYWNKPNT